MLSVVNTCALEGLYALPVKVEVDVSNGLPAFDIVGLPAATIKEARERVRTAIRNSGYEFPLKRITVNLAPGNIRKEGTCFDLPIAIGILMATEQVAVKSEMDFYFAGELSLDGFVRPIKGGLAFVEEIANYPKSAIVIGQDNAAEVRLPRQVPVLAFENLKDIVDFFKSNQVCWEEVKRKYLFAETDDVLISGEEEFFVDFAEVYGQALAKRALEIAAAGGHNVLMVGPPGSGKSMLAKRLPTILPPLEFSEVLAVTKIYSVAGLLSKEKPLKNQRPFRSPHHHSTPASLIGGGRPPQPGELTLGSYGVLFMDELPEFRREVLETLRQPLEEGIINIARVGSTVQYPACPEIFVAAMNPCPCGYLGDKEKGCSCSPWQVQRYQNKISGPFLDRIDLQVEVGRMDYETLTGKINAGETSAAIKNRVIKARKIQKERFIGKEIQTNGRMRSSELRKYCDLSREAKQVLAKAFTGLNLSPRAHDRILKVARTIADLAGSDIIEVQHLAEALQYRGLDRKYWQNSNGSY